MPLIDYAFDRETRADVRSFRMIVIIAIFVCIALFKSCSELKLSVWGRDATATIVRVEPSLYDDLDQRVFFSYADETGRSHRVDRTVSIPVVLTAGEEVAIVYRPGHEDSAVLAHERSMKWPMTLAGLSIAGLAVFISAYYKSRAGEL